VRVVGDLIEDREHLESCQRHDFLNSKVSYILMASKRKNNDWQAIQDRDSALWLNRPDNASIRHGIPFYEMRQYEYNQVSNGYQCNNTGIFQRVQTP